MDAKSEAKALEDAERHAREFIAEHNIPIREWQLAEQMTKDHQDKLLAHFWKLWREEREEILLRV